MQATEVDQTHSCAPYDSLLATRCRSERGRIRCIWRGGDVDWSRPGTHGFRCKSCRAYNVARIVALTDRALLRPMRCRNEMQGIKCAGEGDVIDWNAPGTHAFECQNCKAFNVVHIVEVVRGR